MPPGFSCSLDLTGPGVLGGCESINPAASQQPESEGNIHFKFHYWELDAHLTFGAWDCWSPPAYNKLSLSLSFRCEIFDQRPTGSTGTETRLVTVVRRSFASLETGTVPPRPLVKNFP